MKFRYQCGLPLCLALATPSHLYAQEIEIPDSVFRDIDIIPDGWKLYDKAEGDLNGDGVTDSVLVIQAADPALVIDNPDGLGVRRYDANRRILLFLVSQESGELRLAGRDDAVIPARNDPVIDDPYTDLKIKDGKVTLQLNFWASAGTWWMSYHQFHFLWDGAAMEVIGYDGARTHRANGEVSEVSINFLTMRRKEIIGNRIDGQLEEKWSDLEPADKLTIGKIGNGFEAVDF